jgi:hypothetical protein
VRLSAAAFPPQCGKTVLPIVDTSMAAGKCFLDMLGVFAEFETNLRRERQLEGIAKAKAAGVYKGRPASIDAARVRELKAQGWALRRYRRPWESAGQASTGRYDLRRPASICPVGDVDEAVITSSMQRAIRGTMAEPHPLLGRSAFGSLKEAVAAETRRSPQWRPPCVLSWSR